MSKSLDGTDRSDSFKPIPPKRTHREKEIVTQAIKDMAKSFPIKESTDVDLLVGRLKEIIKRVSISLNQIDTAVRAQGGEHNRKVLREQTEMWYLEALSQFSKDELHLLFTMVLSDMSIKEVV